MTALTLEEAAIVAAAQSAEATAELLRYAREGAYTEASPFNDEVIPKLAEALKLAIDIEGDPPAGYLDADELQLLTNLRTAVAAFIEGWAG